MLEGNPGRRPVRFGSAAAIAIICGVVAAFLAAASLDPAGGMASGSSIRNPDYRGRFDLGDLGKRGRVTISVFEEADRRRHVLFGIRDMPVVCDTTQESRSYPSTRVPFVNRNVFYRDGMFETVTGSHILLVIKGRIRERGRSVSGYVRLFEIRPDPGSGDPDAGADCTTLGDRQEWRAGRT